MGAAMPLLFKSHQWFLKDIQKLLVNSMVYGSNMVEPLVPGTWIL